MEASACLGLMPQFSLPDFADSFPGVVIPEGFAGNGLRGIAD